MGGQDGDLGERARAPHDMAGHSRIVFAARPSARPSAVSGASIDDVADFGPLIPLSAFWSVCTPPNLHC